MKSPSRACLARRDVVPESPPALPDPPRWIETDLLRRRERPIDGGSPYGRRREVDHAAITAPSNALRVRSPPSPCPPRPASTSATCFATLRRSRSPSPVTPNSLPRCAASIHRTKVTHRSTADPPTTRDGLVCARTARLDAPFPSAATPR